MPVLRPAVRIRVVDTSGRHVPNARVVATGFAFARLRSRQARLVARFLRAICGLLGRAPCTPSQTLAYQEDGRRYTTGLKPGFHSITVTHEGSESQTRDVRVTKEGLDTVFVIGPANLPHYYRGRIKVPFDHPDTYAVAVRGVAARRSFMDVAKEGGVDLGPLGIVPVEFDDAVEPAVVHAQAKGLGYAVQIAAAPHRSPVREQGVQVFRVHADRAREFEQRVRALPSVRAVGAVVRQTRRSVSFLTDEIVCQMKRDRPLPPIVRRLGGAARALHRIPGRWLVKASPEVTSWEVVEVCNELANDVDVAWAEPNLFTTTRAFAPTFQVGSAATGWLNLQQPHHELIRTVDTAATAGAWQVTTGAQATIAIVDGGCDVGHPDFAGRIRQVCNFAVAPADGNNVDSDDHGTCCTGIAAGAANALFGYSGVAPDASLVIVQRSGDTDTNFADIFRWCAGKATNRTDLPRKGVNIDVVSCSWDLDQLALSQQMIDAFDELTQVDCCVVFSSGDFNLNFGAESFGALAAYEGNIAVGSSTFTLPQQRAPNSAYGLALEVVAPAGGRGTGETQTTYPTNNGNYGYFANTSCACPQVAGVVALMQSARRENGKRPLTPAEVRDVLTQTAAKIPNPSVYTASGFNSDCGYGQVDAAAAVAAALAM